MLLLFLLLRVYFVTADINCSPRIDVLDGSTLPRALSTFLTSKRSSSSPEECAVQCYKEQCDVAYYHFNRHFCQFTANSTTYEKSVRLKCSIPRVVRVYEDTKATNDIRRYCLNCPVSSRSASMAIIVKQTHRGITKNRIMPKIYPKVHPAKISFMKTKSRLKSNIPLWKVGVAPKLHTLKTIPAHPDRPTKLIHRTKYGISKWRASPYIASHHRYIPGTHMKTRGSGIAR